MILKEPNDFTLDDHLKVQILQVKYIDIVPYFSYLTITPFLVSVLTISLPFPFYKGNTLSLPNVHYLSIRFSNCTQKVVTCVHLADNVFCSLSKVIVCVSVISFVATDVAV